MALNRSSAFNPEDKKLAKLTKALSHPARIAILKILSEENMLICGDIVKSLPLAQSTVSQHLQELKKANLITHKVNGLKSCYQINYNTINEFYQLMQQFFDTTNKL